MIILDASALVKLVVRERESNIAIYAVNSAIQNGEMIASPEISLLETLNRLWKHHVFAKDVSTKEYYEAVERTQMTWARIKKIIIDSSILDLATKLAIENKITVYDAVYLSSSKLNNATLFSFDKKMLQACERLDIRSLKIEIR